MCGEGMSRPGKRSMRSVSIQGKLEAIRRVHEGESKASVARDLGVPESTLRGWCKNENKINQLSRQSSSPDAVADLGAEPKSKRARVGDDAAAAAAAAAVVAAAAPFNLSLRAGGGRYSPNNDTVATARRASPPNTTPPGRNQNGRTAEATVTAATVAAKLPPSSTDSDAGRVVARSMDAIARMAAEAAVAQANSLQTAAAGSYQAELLHQWTLLQRMMRPNQQPSSTVQQHHSKKSAPLKIDINNGTALPSTSANAPGDSLLTTVVRPSEKHSAAKSSASSSVADESLALWLQTQQAALSTVQSYPHTNGVDNNKKHSAASASAASSSSSLPSTITSSSSGMFPIPSTSANGVKYSATITNMMSDALLNWYKYATLAPLSQAMHTVTPAVPTTVAAAAAAAAVPATLSAAVPASPAVPAAVVATEPSTTPERPILYKHLTKKPKRRPVQKEAVASAAAAAAHSSYPICEQEFAEDLSTGRGRNSESGESRLSSNASPASSMSIPSPPERPLSANPPMDEEPPSSPASSSSSSFTRMLVASSPAVQKETTPAAFAGPSAVSLTPPPPPMITTATTITTNNNNTVVQQKVGNNGQLQNGKVTRPKKQINTLLAQFESHHDIAKDVEEGGPGGGEEEPLPADWREAVGHGERFLRWLESGMETAVTHFQVNQFKTIIAKVKANGELKERR